MRSEEKTIIPVSSSVQSGQGRSGQVSSSIPPLLVLCAGSSDLKLIVPFLQHRGVAHQVIDVESPKPEVDDVIRSEVWDRLRTQLHSGHWSGVLAELPEETFTPRLRGCRDKEIYGLESRKDERVREFTLRGPGRANSDIRDSSAEAGNRHLADSRTWRSAQLSCCLGSEGDEQCCFFWPRSYISSRGARATLK